MGICPTGFLFRGAFVRRGFCAGRRLLSGFLFRVFFISSQLGVVYQKINNDQFHCEEESKGPHNIDKWKSIRSRYTSSIAMHALNHIIEGVPWEKIFWSLKLMMVIIVAIILTKNLIINFFNYSVDTQQHMHVRTSVHKPTFLLCTSDYREEGLSLNDCTNTSSRSYDEDI